MPMVGDSNDPSPLCFVHTSSITLIAGSSAVMGWAVQEWVAWVVVPMQLTESFNTDE